VLASGRVDAGVPQTQALDRNSAYEVRVDDLLDIVGGDSAIPDPIRIDHDVGSVFALVQASGLVCPDFTLKAALGQFLLEKLLQRGLTRWIAAAPRMSIWPLIPADENVFLKLGHEEVTGFYQAMTACAVGSVANFRRLRSTIFFASWRTFFALRALDRKVRKVFAKAAKKIKAYCGETTEGRSWEVIPDYSLSGTMVFSPWQKVATRWTCPWDGSRTVRTGP